MVIIQEKIPKRYQGLLAVFVLALGAMAFIWPRAEGNFPPYDAERKIAAKPLTVPPGMSVATFAGGCFWGVEETFRQIPGVVDARSGFTGGTTPAPTYETVHTDTSGHVEAVRVVYDPAKVEYATLLKAFFRRHDPTIPDKVGVAEGRQYRSFIFVHEAMQKKVALATIAELQKVGGYRGAPRPIVTQIRAASDFWPADEYHQRYYEKRGTASACAL